jgi:RNA polymerase sigma-70 factor (ECF subfamily)
MLPLLALPTTRDDAPDDWLAGFHRGDRRVLERCYREHFETVARAVGSVLDGVDRESAIHDFFARLIADEGMRRSFQGGTLGGWLWVGARRTAIDVARARHREREVLAEMEAEQEAPEGTSAAEDLEARRLIAEFRSGPLPAKWAAVFEARFLRQLSQREAAAALAMRRTTLAYQELRIRRLLRRFLLSRGRP